MMEWYYLSVVALFFYGFQYFLYKVAAVKHCNSALTNFAFVSTSAVLAIIAFLIQGEGINDWGVLLFFSALNAVLFLIANLSKLEAVKFVDMSVAFPIIRMSTVMVILFSIFYFKDTLNFYQIIGLILAVLVILVLAKENSYGLKNKDFKKGILLAFITLIFGAATTINVKFAALSLNIFAFIALTNMINGILSLILKNKFNSKGSTKNALIIGASAGALNFVGFSLLLMALKIGPLSLVSSINSMSFVIGIGLSVLIYKEEINANRIIGTVLAILAVILLGMG